MTNQIALFLCLFIVGLIAADVVFFDSTNLLFLSRKFLEFTEWLAFWR